MNKLNVGIYLRLSNEDKNKTATEQSESIKNQRNLLIDYINKNENFFLYQEYCDEDLSGAGTYRPEFERLIKDCEKGKINIVLCKSQSRFSRDMEIIEKYIHNKFIEWNIRFISLSDNADTLIKGNKKSRQINGLVNEWYLEDVSNNIRSAFLSKMKQGEFISPFAPYGYKISKHNNNKLVIDKVASSTIKYIYKLYLKGYSLTKIKEELNKNNIPSPSLYKYLNGSKLNIISNKKRTDIKWNTNIIKNILTNEIYIGNLIQGKRTTISYKNHKVILKPKNEWIKKENTHSPIIDKITFNKVQNIIKTKNKPLKKTGTIHTFSGKVYCLNCNTKMRKKNSSKHTYLECTNTHCQNKTIRYDILEGIILNEINKNIKKYITINDIEKELTNNIKNNQNKETNSLLNEKNKLTKKLHKTNNYIKCLYEDKVNKIITDNEFKELLNIYNIDISFINKRLSKINKKINTINMISPKINNVEFNKLNRIIIEEFIDKIYVSSIKNLKRDINIKWNY